MCVHVHSRVCLHARYYRMFIKWCTSLCDRAYMAGVGPLCARFVQFINNCLLFAVQRCQLLPGFGHVESMGGCAVVGV